MGHPPRSSASFMYSSIGVSWFRSSSRPTSVQPLFSLGRSLRLSIRDGDLDTNLGVLHQLESRGSATNLSGDGEADDPIVCEDYKFRGAIGKYQSYSRHKRLALASHVQEGVLRKAKKTILAWI